MNTPSTVADLLAWTARRTAHRSATPERASALLARCGLVNPPHESIKIAGTNGKGSVCRMLEACLLASGRRVGMFTSPHLERMTERIRLDGVEITAESLETYARELAPTLYAVAAQRGPAFVPSFFEVLLLIALRAFSDAKIDVAVIEAGIGGAHDATGVIPAAVSAVTSVGFDHEVKLGTTLAEVAVEKAGIATRGSTLVLAASISDDLADAMEHSAALKNVRTIRARRDGVIENCPTNNGVSTTLRADPDPIVLNLPDWPPYQLDNLATLMTILDTCRRPFDPPTATVLGVLEQLRFPGRFECIGYGVSESLCAIPGHARSAGVSPPGTSEVGAAPVRARSPAGPEWLLDGAHNAEAIDALIDALNHRFPTRHRVLIFGASQGKNVARYLHRLPEIAPRAFITDDFHNAMDAAALHAAMSDRSFAARWTPPLDVLLHTIHRDRSFSDALVVVTGSLFLVGKVRLCHCP